MSHSSGTVYVWNTFISPKNNLVKIIDKKIEICYYQNMIIINTKDEEVKSENLWDNPEYIIKEKNITTFPVYIDTTNRKKYHLSLEDIEKE